MARCTRWFHAGDSSSSGAGVRPARLEVSAAALLLSLAPGAHLTPVLALACDPIEEVSSDELGDNARVLIDPVGNVYAWWEFGSSQDHFAIRPPGGPFGAPQGSPEMFDPFDNRSLQIGFDSAGNAIFMWNGGSSLKTAYRSAGASGTFGPVQSLGDDSAFDLSVNSAGDAMVIWDETAFGGSAIQVAFRPAGSDTLFGTPQTLASEYGASVAVVLDDDRSAVTAWLQTSTGPFKQATQPMGSTDVDFTVSGSTISTMGSSPVFFGKASGPGGRAVMVAYWGPANQADIYASLRDPGGEFGPLNNISGIGTEHNIEPRSSVGPDGDVAVAWLLRDSSTQPCIATPELKVAVSKSAPGSGFSPPFFYDSGEGLGGAPDVAALPASAALAVSDEVLTSDCSTLRIVAGDGSSTDVLSDLTVATVFDPSIAGDSQGSTYVVWESTTVGGKRIRGRFCSAPCDFPLDLVLSDDTITTEVVQQACNSITTGPNFAVQGPGGDLTLLAPLVILGSGTSAGVDARLTVGPQP